ncbi:MAG: lactonase family protein [Acidobacteriota bacterium]|nr:lactonase family protein [Acidobacteriota bacterium]
MSSQNKNFTRRRFLQIAGFSIAGISLAGSLAAFGKDKNREMLLYVGTYTSGKSEGIYIYKFDSETGELKPHKTVKNVSNPSYLTIDNKRRFLYAVNEETEFQGKKSGAVSSFAIDQASGDLRFINQQPSLGGAPCYVSASENGKFILAANYVGGNVCVLPIQTNGQLGNPVDLAQHAGSSVNLERQESAHAHSIVLDKKNKFAFSCDLGSDKIYIYLFDRKIGKLTPNPRQTFYQTKAGAGPRHIVLSENQKNAFVINELDSTISALSFDKRQGTLREIQTLSTLPADYKNSNNTGADIHISPSGKFLYGSNRGHDSIVVYRIDEKTGKLEYVENVLVEGKKPRNFAIDPTEKFLLVANQDSDTITTFKIDAETGKLRFTEQKTSVPVPVCLKLISSFGI